MNDDEMGCKVRREAKKRATMPEPYQTLDREVNAGTRSNHRGLQGAKEGGGIRGVVEVGAVN
jgi:hypothetical protein